MQSVEIGRETVPEAAAVEEAAVSPLGEVAGEVAAEVATEYFWDEPVADVYEQTGGACVCHPGFEGSCPVAWCRHHLDSQDRRTWKQMPRRRPDDSDTCSMRLANQGGRTLEEVAVLLGLTRERVRQIEEAGMARMTRGFIRLQLLGKGEIHPDLRHRLKISRSAPGRGTSGGET